MKWALIRSNHFTSPFHIPLLALFSLHIWAGMFSYPVSLPNLLYVIGQCVDIFVHNPNNYHILIIASRLATCLSKAKSVVLTELYGRLNLHLVRANAIAILARSLGQSDVG